MESIALHKGVIYHNTSIMIINAGFIHCVQLTPINNNYYSFELIVWPMFVDHINNNRVRITVLVLCLKLVWIN